MPTHSDDFYEILQVHPKAEPEVIKAAYYRLSQKYHPDHNPNQAEQMDWCMKRLNEAYAVLSDPARRAAYDRQGVAGQQSSNYANPPDIHGWSAEKVQAWQRETAAQLGLPVFFRHKLNTGGEGPVMAVIPPGSFLMGSPPDEPLRNFDEGPQHRVSFAKPFAIGRFAVSFAEYDLFCESTGKKMFFVWSTGARAKPRDAGWGRGQRPVINVDWDDAQAYCRWLSEQTGKNYRLPSEAEWEYACRAGTTTPFYWGNTLNTRQANFDGNYSYFVGAKGEYRDKTVPVGEFEPNAFGLYQMHGNVWEWCEDVFHEYYQEGAPTDGSAWAEGGGSLRVFRGGSWYNDNWSARSAFRNRLLPDNRSRIQGFRLAQD